MRHYRFCCLLLLTLLLKSCEIPDVHPFTKATTDMSAAMQASLTQVVADVKRSHDLYASANPTAPQALDSSSIEKLRAAAARFAAVTRAFNHYAQALDKLVSVGEKRGKAIDNVFNASKELVDASKGFLGPAATLTGVAKTTFDALDKVANDINDAHTIHNLKKLASPDQDTLIQRTARVLRLGMQEFSLLEEKADMLSSIYEKEADYQRNIETYYEYSLKRQELATALLAKIVSAEYWLIAAKHPEEVKTTLKYLATPANDPQGLLAKAEAQHTSPLLALYQLEAFYRDFAGLPQAQYDVAKSAYQSRHQGNELLKKNGQLIDSWASSHHELQLLLVKADRVTRQDLISYAQATQKLVDEVKALNNN